MDIKSTLVSKPISNSFDAWARGFRDTILKQGGIYGGTVNQARDYISGASMASKLVVILAKEIK